MKVLIILLLFSSPAYAQSTKTWDKISWISVGTQVGLDTIHSIRSDNKKREFLQQGIRVGATSLVTRITKHYVHKERPDGSDDKSFFSGHSAQAAAAQFSGYKFQITIPITGLTMLGRVKAKKHYDTDVIVGALVGTVIGGLTERYVK